MEIAQIVLKYVVGMARYAHALWGQGRHGQARSFHTQMAGATMSQYGNIVSQSVYQRIFN